MSTINLPRALLILTYLHITAVVIGLSVFMTARFFSQTLFLPAVVVSASYLLFCVTSVFWRPHHLMRQEAVRRPDHSEKNIIDLGAVNLMMSRCGIKLGKFKIYVMDDDQITAFATGFRTICISSGSLRHLSTMQVTSVLLHQAGRIRSFDTLLSIIFTTAYDCASILQIAVVKLWFAIKRIPLLLLLVLLCALTLITTRCPVIFFYTLLSCGFLVYGITVINKIYAPMWERSISTAEITQDRFVTEAGYGEQLIQVLLKIGGTEERIRNIRNKN